MRSWSTRRALIHVLAALATTLTGVGALRAEETPPALPHARDDMRLPWQRNDERYLRRWLVVREFAPPARRGGDALAIDYLAAQGGEAAARPAEGQEVTKADGSKVRWKAEKSWSDVVTLEDPTGPSPRRRGVAYAFTAVKRAAAGKALLAVGSDEGLRIWVNGALVHEWRGRRSLTLDEDRVEVTMNAGDNAVLVKTEQSVGAWSFALRVLEPGAVLARRAEIGPSIVAGGAPGVLRVRTDTRAGEAGQSHVTVVVLAAGGKEWARQSAARGETVELPTATWPDGPYEVLCTAERPDGRSYAAHLPYYKGDALAAARKLVAAAAMADDSQPAGFTLKMLAELVVDRLGGKIQGDADSWRLIHSPLMEYEELQQTAAGRDGAARPYGFVRLAYRDEVDGTPQFARAYLPAAYDSAKKWPLVLNLHGYNPANPIYIRWWAVDARHNDLADDKGVIFVEPHGRGNTSYRGMGERDVLRCLELAKARFNVDADRVYLMGDSMGGWGTWQVGSRHPELFAAIAPIFGGGDFRLDIGDEAFAKMSPRERFAAERRSSFVQAEALINLPIFVTHGDVDASVKIDYSRYVVRMLQRWGYDVRYWERPGFGHEDMRVHAPIIDWFLTHRRKAQPRHVRLRAAELKSARAYWVRIEGNEEPLRMMDVDAEVVEPNVIRLDSENVEELTLRPPAALVDPSRPLRVVWNGEPRGVSLGDGAVTLRAANAKPTSLRKRPELEGPIEDLHATPFAVVVGTTSADARMQAMCAAKGEVFATLWEQWQHHRPRVFKDSELSAADAARYSLLLIGGPEANAVTARLADKLPLSVAADRISVGGRPFAVQDAAVQMIYPSPLNAERYVSVVAGTSADGLYFWDPVLMDDSLGEWDFAIVDGRTASGGADSPVELRRVTSGIFDRDWSLAAGVVVEGDTELRAKNPLSRAPRADHGVDPKTFDGLVGAYELGPGYSVKIARDGARFMALLPDNPPLEILPLSANEYAATMVNLQFIFMRDPTGKATMLTLRAGGRNMPARRVE